MDRARGYEPRGWGFDSLTARHNTRRLAQLDQSTGLRNLGSQVRILHRRPSLALRGSGAFFQRVADRAVMYRTLNPYQQGSTPWRRTNNALVMELADILDSESRFWGFEAPRGYHHQIRRH